MFEVGDRVITPDGVGEVVYRLMKSPDYSDAAAYSVKLDHLKDNVLYCGTMYNSDKVSKES